MKTFFSLPHGSAPVLELLIYSCLTLECSKPMAGSLSKREVGQSSAPYRCHPGVAQKRWGVGGSPLNSTCLNLIQSSEPAFLNWCVCVCVCVCVCAHVTVRESIDFRLTETSRGYHRAFPSIASYPPTVFSITNINILRYCAPFVTTDEPLLAPWY